MTSGVSTGETPPLAEPSVVAGLRQIPEVVRRRLTPGLRRWDWLSWGATLWVAGIAALVRLWNLGFPTGKVFDELYYATEAGELLEHGTEWEPTTNSGQYVVHPPLGKWMIAVGIKVFGDNATGWRIAAAVAGIISVIILTRTARRMFKSTVLGCAAGLLMAMDGMHLVLSRSALLDIFLMFWIVVAFACLVLDRDQRRARWVRAMESGAQPDRPGRVNRPPFTWAGMPWWRFATGASLGLACAVKWSAVWFIPVFIVLMFWWEVGARRSAGVRHPWRDAFLDETGWIACVFLFALAAYLFSWTGWFLSDSGWKRHFLASQGKSEPPIIGDLMNLWYYHKEAYDFHKGLESPHVYQSWPWQWLLLARPVAFYYNSDPKCGAATCSGEILLLGTPALWWSFIPALIGTTWFGIARRDWRALAIWAGVGAGLLPWFYYEFKQRTMFYFYALPAEPFLILAVVYVLGCIINAPPQGRAGPSRRWTLPPDERRLYGTVFAALFIALVALCFAWFYPLYVGTSIPYQDWARHMWLDRWI